MGSLNGSMSALEAKANVLVVDDDAGVANWIGRVLVQRGLLVDIAGDGAAALERIESQTYDVMVLDLRMSNLDGLEVLRALRSRPNPPETILHSAFLDVPTTVEAMKCGVADVIEKSVSPDVLGDRVLNLVRRKQATRAGIPQVTSSTRSAEPVSAPEHGGAFPAATVVRQGVTLPDLERELIIGAFSMHSPNLSKTAKYLGIPRSTLRDKLRKFGVL